MGLCLRSFIVRDLQSVNRTRTCDTRLIMKPFSVHIQEELHCICVLLGTRTSVCSLKLMCLVVQALGDCRHAQVRRTDLAEQTSQLLKLSLMRMQHVSC